MTNLDDPNGVFYRYIFPILSSLFAGFVFWFFISYLPESRRERRVAFGIAADLIKVNNILFGYFDRLMRFHASSPSSFQPQIHACALTEEEINTALQNKVSNGTYLFDPKIAGQLMVVGEELIRSASEVNMVIDRLYAFNYFLSPEEIQNLRNIQEKLGRYDLKRAATTKWGDQTLHPKDPSLAYMTNVILELQADFAWLREQLFTKKSSDRAFVISKIQRLYNRGEYGTCISECNRWIKSHPFDSDLHKTYLIRSYMKSGKAENGYHALSDFLKSDADLMSHRELLYPLLSDSIAAAMIQKKYTTQQIDEMKRVVEESRTVEAAFLASNSALKRYHQAK